MFDGIRPSVGRIPSNLSPLLLRHVRQNSSDDNVKYDDDVEYDDESDDDVDSDESNSPYTLFYGEY